MQRPLERFFCFEAPAQYLDSFYAKTPLCGVILFCMKLVFVVI